MLASTQSLTSTRFAAIPSSCSLNYLEYIQYLFFYLILTTPWYVDSNALAEISHPTAIGRHRRQAGRVRAAGGKVLRERYALCRVCVTEHGGHGDGGGRRQGVFPFPFLSLFRCVVTVIRWYLGRASHQTHSRAKEKWRLSAGYFSQPASSSSHTRSSSSGGPSK